MEVQVKKKTKTENKSKYDNKEVIFSKCQAKLGVWKHAQSHHLLSPF